LHESQLISTLDQPSLFSQRLPLHQLHTISTQRINAWKIQFVDRKSLVAATVFT